MILQGKMVIFALWGKIVASWTEMVWIDICLSDSGWTWENAEARKIQRQAKEKKLFLHIFKDQNNPMLQTDVMRLIFSESKYEFYRNIQEYICCLLFLNTKQSIQKCFLKKSLKNHYSSYFLKSENHKHYSASHSCVFFILYRKAEK